MKKLFIFLLAVIPAVLWAVQNPEFSTAGFGRLFGLIGMALFSIVMVLSSRIRIFDKIFWGINQSYIVHHILGGIAFSLILMHPILLAVRLAFASFRQAALFLLPSAFWPANFGFIALCIMLVALITTFYLKQAVKYQNWKLIHQFMGISFIFAVFHIFLIGSDIGRNPFLKFYMGILAVAGISAYIYRTVLGARLVNKYTYEVLGTAGLGDNTNEVKLLPAGPGMKFESGQFMFISFKSRNISSEIHPFTISSSPLDGAIRLSIKESGDWTAKIKNLLPGDKAEIEGPYGKFNFRNYKNKNQIWIAGGIGVTPFLSMARDLSEGDKDYNIDFYYSAKTKEGFIFQEELSQIAEKYKNFRINFWATDAQGFISAEKINPSRNADFLICGPVPMMSALKKQFLKIGFSKGQLHTEEFEL